MNSFIAKSARLRSTPFSERIEAYGVESYTVYNHMLLPASFKGVEEDYHHLKENVQLWDVSVERQVQITDYFVSGMWLTLGSSRTRHGKNKIASRASHNSTPRIGF